MDHDYYLMFFGVIVFLFWFFMFVAHHRFIDGDEGFYLLASQLVLEHKVPYVDFFYTQSPLLPYAYGLWMKLFGISWWSARAFSAMLSTIIGLLIYQEVCRQTRKWIAGLAAVIVFASTTLIFAWFPLAKTYSLAGLFLFTSYAMIARLSPVSSPWIVALAGLSFGLSVDTRAYVVGLIPILLWWVFRNPDVRNGTHRVFWFLGGFTVGIAPCLYLFVSGPDRFLFNNLGYHALRTDAGLIGGWRHKLGTVINLFIGREGNGIQFSLLSAISFVTVAALRIRNSALLLAFLIAVVLGFISILPTPTFVQYFCLCMPFLIVTAVCGITHYATSVHAVRSEWIAVLAIVAVLAYVASSSPSFRSYIVTGDNVIGLANANDAPNWSLENVSTVSKTIDQLTAQKEQIASFWPGYIFATKATPYPGLENDFGGYIADKLTADQRAKYHIVSNQSDIAVNLRSHIPRIVVVGNQANGGFGGVPGWIRLLRANGYTAGRTLGGTEIFVCCSAR
jgi:4-amino-4-deoxy-L-arabinose transferase-like glycosyltransferase